MRCINSGKQRKFIYALSTARYKLRASNGAPPILFHPGKVPCALLPPPPLYAFISFLFSFLPGLQIIGERFNCKARLAMRHLSDDSFNGIRIEYIQRNGSFDPFLPPLIFNSSQIQHISKFVELFNSRCNVNIIGNFDFQHIPAYSLKGILLNVYLL